VDDEMRERKNAISMQVKICEDGKLYLLIPIPEGATMEEVNEAQAILERFENTGKVVLKIK